jgi:small-conductance mechanosensitive channel
VGDRIEVNGIIGDILDIQLLRTTLQECRNWLGCDDHTGRIVVIPNHFILKAHLFNYNFMHPMIWRQLDVLVTYETPPQAAYDLLKRVLEEEARENVEEFRKDERRMQAEFDLTEPPQELKIHTTIADSGVHFALLYPVHYRKSASFRSRLSKRIVDEFAKRPELQFAYPTQRHIPTPEPGGLKVQVTQR